jgi:predicted dienelactone hydrolase
MTRLLAVLLIVALIIPALVLASTLTAQESPPLPLAEPGLYEVGVTTMTFEDERREAFRRTGKKRELVTEIWYPAIHPEGEGASRDAKPDATGAPYPLVVFSHWWTGDRLSWQALTRHLASHGFVVAAVDHKDVPVPYGELIDRPMDILFVIDRLAALAEGDLVGMVDTDNVGVTGYSSGGVNALEVNGAQIDPAYYLAWCRNFEPTSPLDDICELFAASWDEIVAYRAQFDPPLDTSGDALWPPFSDKRIRAVLPMSPCYGPLFGERGLAAASVPTLMMVGATDTCLYEGGAVTVYERLGVKERYLITFLRGGHEAAYYQPDIAKHFATAFFGYLLQGQGDYAEYLTEEYVERFDNLAWGVPEGE